MLCSCVVLSVDPTQTHLRTTYVPVIFRNQNLLERAVLTSDLWKLSRSDVCWLVKRSFTVPHIQWTSDCDAMLPLRYSTPPEVFIFLLPHIFPQPHLAVIHPRPHPILKEDRQTPHPDHLSIRQQAYCLQPHPMPFSNSSQIIKGNSVNGKHSYDKRKSLLQPLENIQICSSRSWCLWSEGCWMHHSCDRSVKVYSHKDIPPFRNVIAQTQAK